jgi:hypothetical protein
MGRPPFKQASSETVAGTTANWFRMLNPADAIRPISTPTRRPVRSSAKELTIWAVGSSSSGVARGEA